VSRLPIRIRVTLAFSAVMSLVLAGAGLFVYLSVGEQLDASIDQGLRSRAGEVSALIRTSGPSLDAGDSLIEAEESFAQVVAMDGRVVDSTAQLEGQAALGTDQLRRAAGGPTFFDRAGLTGIDGDARVLAVPVDTGGEDRIAVVGSSLEDRDESLASLTAVLLIGGPIALLLASLAGYGAAAGALRPVEAMRSRAAEISADEPDERLPLGAANDELSRLGRTLNEMLDRLEAAIERERRFVDDASHELRTPLTLHKTELEIALRYGASEEELRTAIAAAIADIDRLVQLAEDLLVVARSEGGKLALRLEPVVVGELVEAVRERFGSRAASTGRPLLAEAQAGLVVEGDRLRLEQALTSMVENALRYGEGEVRLRGVAVGGGVELHVGDRGPGFPPEFIGRAFERFATADAARGSSGSGLGLAIVATIARAHGGDVGAVNDPGGGADVWIALPGA
jgi:two-component system, OmpR family, sensor kinase